jgi:hypothetical protein
VTEPHTATETADLLSLLQCLRENRPADPREQATVLAYKAYLLARIADHRAREWGQCDYTTQALEIAREARAIAQNARRLAAGSAPADGGNWQENPPAF